MSNILVDQFEGVTVLMSHMVVGGGASTNMDCDELLLVFFDLRVFDQLIIDTSQIP